MEKIKIKMPFRNYSILSDLLSQFTIDQVDLNGIIQNATIQEMRSIFKRVVMLNEGTHADKEISKQFPEVDCIVFYLHFNGLSSLTGYNRVAVRTVCHQIENKLFKSGKYILQQKMFSKW